MDEAGIRQQRRMTRARRTDTGYITALPLALALGSPFLGWPLATQAATTATPAAPASATTATLQPIRECASLTGEAIPASAIALPTGGARITSATVIEAQPERIGADSVRHATPAYCAVLGSIAPIDPAAPPIQFQVNVPTAWNHKALHIGGGGLNGRIPANLAEIGSSGSPISGAFPPNAPYPIALGYASYGGDSGHSEPGLEATWALNDEAWTNFGHAALKKTHDAAFAVLQALYGTTPDVNYFMGQSQGGREALEVAQRYPEDYDGVVATAPLIGYVPHVLHKTLLAQAQVGDGWIAPELQALIGAEVMRQCDALDGLADGVISAYEACSARFDPQTQPQAFAAIRCADGVASTATAACLSDAQIATIAQMHTPLTFDAPLANGWQTFPGYGVGRESHKSWLNLAELPTPATVAKLLSQPGSTVRYAILKDPDANLLALDLAAQRERIEAASALLDTTNPDLSRFFARGGRLLVKVGSADYNANPRTMMRYYDAVVQHHGQAEVDQHLRFYVQPDGNHGGEGVDALTGAPIPQYVNLIALMTDWVERGVEPPAALEIQRMDKLPPYAVTATRPLCPYPQYPHYDGQGDPNQAASFACRR